MLSSPAHPLIGIDPEIRFGRACIAGTRISTNDVLGWLKHGMSYADIIADFPELTVETIGACQRYANDCVEPYSHTMHSGPDFCVTYRLFTAEEGGRKTPAYQHIRWDFCYEEKAISTRRWMIWPEILDPDGKLIPNGPFSPVGQANMFIMNPEMRDFHRQHIKPGVRGFFMDGLPAGVCEVTEIIGLHQ